MCDAAHHQTCHRPRIPDAVLDDPDSKWYCVSCTSPGAQVTPVLDLTDIVWEESLPAGQVPPITRQAYLDDLPRAYLKKIVEMLLERYPEARVFPKDVQAQVARAAATAAVAGEASQPGKRKRDEAEEKYLHAKVARLDQNIPALRTYTQTPRDPPSYRPEIDPSLAAQPANGDTGGTLPPYEEMIVQALNYIDDPNGSLPRLIFEWMNECVSRLSGANWGTSASDGGFSTRQRIPARRELQGLGQPGSTEGSQERQAAERRKSVQGQSQLQRDGCQCWPCICVYAELR